MSDSRFPEELLADLHAGVLPPDVEAELWPQVRADPDAMEMIHALDRVSSVLGDFGSAGLSAHGELIPPDLASRLDALFDAPEASVDADPPQNSTVLPLRPRISRRFDRRWSVLAAACALVAMVGAGALWIGTSKESKDTVQAEPSTTPAQSPLVLGEDLPTDTILAALGQNSAQGILATDEGLRACLGAIEIDRQPLGSMPVVMKELHGVLILAAGPEKGLITAVVVNTDCAPGNADVYAERDF